MSFIDDSVLSDAIVRFIGEDRSLTPQDDITAAREAHPDEGPELESAIVETVIPVPCTQLVRTGREHIH